MEGWVFIPFESAVQKVTYTKKIPRKQFLTDGAYPIISQESDFINGYWDNSEDVFSVDSPVVIFGDHTKIIKHIDFDFVLGADGVKILKPIETLSSKFFAYFLNAAPVADLGYARHYRLLKEITVPVPPREEQKRIVAILDEAFADIEQVRAKTEQNLKNARELFESYLQQVFSQRGEGWKETVLGALGKVSMCKRILKKQTAVSGDIPFYKIGTFGRTANAFIGNDIYQEYKEKYSFPKKGDILISAAGTIGRRVIYDGQPAYFQDSNIVWIDNDEKMILNNYLYQFYGVCDWNPSKGATISRLYNDDLRKIKISFPSISEQKELVVRMVALSEKIKTTQINYQKKLEKLDELKKSILQKAFSGELTQKNNQGAVA